MIQRVQSLFLLGATICFGLACFMPIGVINDVEMSYLYTPWVLKQAIVSGLNILQTYYIGLLQVILAVICFVAIFFYKKRPMQSKICTAAIFINFVLVVMLFVYSDRIFPQVFEIEEVYVNYSPWVALSLLPIAFLYIANKLIMKDEKKVRAADRLR